MDDSKRATVYFEADVHQALRLKAAAADRSISDVVNEAVKIALAEDAEDLAAFDPWARVWYLWVSAVFLRAYCAVAGQGAFLPQTREECQVLLDAYLLEKVLYELRYELNSRPDWVNVPLQGILDLVETA